MSKFHLAIFSPNYIDLILTGAKTVESRFSKVKCAPYGKVNTNDFILMKDSGGPVRGVFSVKNIESYELDNDLCWRISECYHKYIFPNVPITDRFYMDRWLECRYATLIEVGKIHSLRKPLLVMKKDRRAWVVLDERHNDKIISDIAFNERYSTIKS